MRPPIGVGVRDLSAPAPLTGGKVSLMNPVGPVAAAFGASKAFLPFIMGPVGGGKTTECIAKGVRVGLEQPAVFDPVRGVPVKKCRGAIVRDTYPNLDRTVIKSWHQWFPKEMGSWSGDAPRRHSFTIEIGVRGTPGFCLLDMEVIFVAIGDHAVEDVLRGLELTWLWLNEADLLPRAIVEIGVGRVGRYPGAKDGGCAMAQIFGDFNAPEDDNWIVSTIIEKKIDPDLVEALRIEFGENRPLIEFFRQPGGLEDGAENLHNLPGGKAYYLKQAALLPDDKKRRFVDNRIGPVRHGTPVYPEFVDDFLYDDQAAKEGHVRPFDLRPGLPILIGADQGICPGVVMAQLWPEYDQLVVFDEMARIFEDDKGHIEVSQMGGEAFGRSVAARLATRYADWSVGLVTADPAAAQGEDAIEHRSWRREFQDGLGVRVRKCGVPGNAVGPRTKAVRDRLGARVPGRPRLLVHPRCTITRKAFNSKYVFQRVAMGAAEGGRFGSKPVKVQGYSDVMNALEYLAWDVAKGLAPSALGAAAPRGAAGGRTITNESDYSMFGGLR